MMRGLAGTTALVTGGGSGTGAACATRDAIPHMIAVGGGAVVNVSSVFGLRAPPGAVAFLSSAEASFITGAALPVDGGFLAR